jgi:anti-anti-sigma regulatory factor
MLRITLVEQEEEEVVLRVEGWISGEGVRLLEAEGERYLKQTGRLVLDLKGMQFIDDAGIALLKRWGGERLVLRDGSPFVRMLLEMHGIG